MVSNLRSHDIVYLLGVIVYILTRFYREHEVELGHLYKSQLCPQDL